MRRACPDAALIGTAYRTADIARAADARPRPQGRIGRVCYFDAVGRGERIFHTSSVALRRSAWSETGGFGPYPSGEDAELWVRIALRWTVARSTRPTAVYHTGTGGIIEERNAARVGRPPASLADLSPAVARLLEAGPALPTPELRAAADAYVHRYFRWRLQEAVHAGDVATVRALARLAPRPLAAGDALLVAAARLPAPAAGAAYRAILLFKALGRPSAPGRWFRRG